MHSARTKSNLRAEKDAIHQPSLTADANLRLVGLETAEVFRLIFDAAVDKGLALRHGSV